MAPKTLETAADLRESVACLVKIEPRFLAIVDEAGSLRLRRSAQGFDALVEMIISQQLSVAASDTIIGRLQDANLFSRPTLAAVPPEQLRACGVSGRKADYLKTMAASTIDLAALSDASDESVIRTLTALRGIGVWTAEIYLMFALGRADVFPAGDLALQESSRMFLELPERPSERVLRKIAADWQPCRTAAAQLLWTLYRINKGRDAVRGG